MYDTIKILYTWFFLEPKGFRLADTHKKKDLEL